MESVWSASVDRRHDLPMNTVPRQRMIVAHWTVVQRLRSLFLFPHGVSAPRPSPSWHISRLVSATFPPNRALSAVSQKAGRPSRVAVVAVVLILPLEQTRVDSATSANITSITTNQPSTTSSSSSIDAISATWRRTACWPRILSITVNVRRCIDSAQSRPRWACGQSNVWPLLPQHCSDLQISSLLSTQI